MLHYALILNKLLAINILRFAALRSSTPEQQLQLPAIRQLRAQQAVRQTAKLQLVHDFQAIVMFSLTLSRLYCQGQLGTFNKTCPHSRG